MFELTAVASSPTQTVAPELVPDYDLKMTVVNERVVIRDDAIAGWRVVLVNGLIYAYYAADDVASERHVCVQLRLSGLTTQAEVVNAFGHVRATQCRWERQYRDEGLSGLFTEPLQGRRSTMPKTVEDAVVVLHGEGLGMRRIAGRLGLTLHEVGGVYKRRSLAPQNAPRQEPLFSEETSGSEAEGAEAVDTTIGEADEDTSATHGDAIELWDGLLVPQYESGVQVPWAGVALALPLLRRHRVLEVFTEIYRSLGVLTFYGLQTMVNVMICLALWRIKRPEHLKGVAPWELGRALGLERVPEVKTVRRKLAQLAGRHQARRVMLSLAEEHLRHESDLLGFLYVDGHVRPYSGQHELGKAFKMQRHMPVRATTDTWANDRDGDPLFVVTSEVNDGLTTSLPQVLDQARELVGDERRVTVVFDRGGWSPQLFVNLIRDGFEIITYRKGRSKDLDPASFERRVLTVGERDVECWLRDEAVVEVSRKNLDWGDENPRPLTMRQVTRLSPKSGHQTKVVTTRGDLEPEEVLWRMFARWRQENFFKYMMEEFAIDGLVEYGAAAVDPNLERPNPEHRAITAEIAAMKARILRLQGQRCELIGDVDAEDEAPPGFERFVPGRDGARQLNQEIGDLKRELDELEERRAEIPARISAGDLKRLRTERQLIATVFKIAAYRVESDLVRRVAPYYSRCEDEGRKLVAAALRSPADIEVTDEELRVTIGPQSSPHRSAAIARLCASLNKLDTVVPGTHLRLVLDCAPEPGADASS